MEKKTKLFISIGLAILGIGLSCISYGCQNGIWKGVIFGLGISILTTAIIDIYEYILNYSRKEIIMESTGFIDIAYNANSTSQDYLYINSKDIRVIFNSGVGTFRKYQKAITESIIKNDCHVKIILSDENTLGNEMYMSGENETNTTKKIIESIINDIKKCNHTGSIELRYSSVPPIDSLEIKDDKFCEVVPYMYQRNSITCYHSTYKNTGNKDDIYHKWKEHFEKVWEKGTTVLKYPI